MPDDAIKKIVIIGSGIVGICTAIELIDRGFSVTLIDPNDPGSQTSYGNAGVLTDSSLMIINNPQLQKIQQLPILLLGLVLVKLRQAHHVDQIEWQNIIDCYGLKRSLLS